MRKKVLQFPLRSPFHLLDSPTPPLQYVAVRCIFTSGLSLMQNNKPLKAKESSSPLPECARYGFVNRWKSPGGV